MGDPPPPGSAWSEARGKLERNTTLPRNDGAMVAGSIKHEGRLCALVKQGL